LAKLLDTDSQSPGFVGIGSAYGHLHGMGVNAVSRWFATQAARARLLFVVPYGCFGQ
jgi:hypothetical protein